jgi:hypothetical protein
MTLAAPSKDRAQISRSLGLQVENGYGNVFVRLPLGDHPVDCLERGRAEKHFAALTADFGSNVSD